MLQGVAEAVGCARAACAQLRAARRRALALQVRLHVCTPGPNAHLLPDGLPALP